MLSELTKQSHEISKLENQKIYDELNLLVTTDIIKQCIMNAISKEKYVACIFATKYDSRINYKTLLTTSINGNDPIFDRLQLKYPEFRIIYAIKHYPSSIFSMSNENSDYFEINIYWGTIYDDCECIIL